MRDIITTSRLTLRRMGQNDVSRLVALCGDIKVAGMLSRMPHPYTLDDAHQWLARQDLMWTTMADRVWGIDLAEEGLIGGIGLHREARMSANQAESWELGYWLGTRYWGQGFATEAGRAALSELDRAQGPQEVTAGYALKNPKSGHVLEKIGFHKLDIVREFSVLATGELSRTQIMFRPAPNTNPPPERSTLP
jgi:[ribosomal protein S5]-alanine N-acetyltransferase